MRVELQGHVNPGYEPVAEAFRPQPGRRQGKPDAEDRLFKRYDK